ncbi:glutamyl-tRNA synthetase [Mycoplasmoides fastidiosum]|uniref:Glutamate--tRNA ligase n=1 Tax=Mycoplasmoides fastidiosum TaxID=92758 RepID=A0ABU0LXX4_9BACT|nr:glutamate--tRNA ligase [Mycoplasmoides fastidiosum]MDQ0513574.1 glutamyl-tRNA synthetase [Mycoplasmoides fastidiosum]UUD38004.1 glutamate--tRNA ligase [Mycoplasmoides fastidiosum]
MNSQIKTVRTRYAPSPTGELHIGGARTAIFNYLFAKRHLGNFILRIEDTDVERNIEEGLASQFDNLKWLNIFPDESFNNPGDSGPYLQSQKLLTYQKIAVQLLEQDLAYRCFCTPAELDQKRQQALDNGQTPRYDRTCLNLSPEEITAKVNAGKEFAIRLKLSDEATYAWDDLIRGNISVPGTALSDYIILRSNKIPTYNFAVVIDDHDMKISHVLRGEEHISNTPYQIATYQALGYTKMPQFAHLSIIIGADGKKLSKRDKTTKQFIENYRKDGFLPEAVVNFLALLGWPGIPEQEIMTLEEMINNFDLAHLSKAPAFFDYKKLLWISGQHFRRLNDKVYWNFVNPFFVIDLNQLNESKEEIALLFKNQISYAAQLNELANNIFNSPSNAQTIFQDHHQVLADNRDVLEIGLKLLPDSTEEWNHANVRAYLKQIMAQTNKKGMDFFIPLRLGLTYSEHGPELFKIIKLMGYQLCRTRLLEVLKFLDEFTPQN